MKKKKKKTTTKNKKTRTKNYFILLAINPLLKIDFPICGPYMFESHMSLQMYDLLSAYFTSRVIRMLCNGIYVFKLICDTKRTYKYTLIVMYLCLTLLLMFQYKIIIIIIIIIIISFWS